MHALLLASSTKKATMISAFQINFDEPKVFEIKNIQPLTGSVGLYFIFTKQTQIQYPFKKSRLLYIGMSERKTNSIGSRLTGHFDGKSKNVGLTNYRKVQPLFFTFIHFEMVRKFWDFRIENLEAYFILDFVEKYGVYPICNNKSGFEVLSKTLNTNFIIDWSYYD
ncbi:hypothetical protein BH23BAC1_BH23BAC1_34130 [soil metagenome]